jgi:hypothetical protein
VWSQAAEGGGQKQMPLLSAVMNAFKMKPYNSMKTNRPFFAAVVATLCATLSFLAAACRPPGNAGDDNAAENAIMKPSVTYLHLLRKTPFFTGLNTDQLRWTIDHSREWEAQPDTVIVDCGAGKKADDAIWILLDGRWQVEANGKIYPAGHADAGKWFSGAVAQGECRLRTTEHSYVMKITRADLAAMLANGFAFDVHLDQGRAYYRQIFGDAASL